MATTFADTLDNAASIALAELVAVLHSQAASIRERLTAAATILRFRDAERRAKGGAAVRVARESPATTIPTPARDVPRPPPAGEVAASSRPEGVSSVFPGGRIVNVAARPALIPELGAGMVAYTASKAAVAAITQSLAAEVAADGILVNAVVPSIMDTPANRKSMPDADHAKWPKVDEVAASIVFLASAENRVTRGALMPVYGTS